MYVQIYGKHELNWIKCVSQVTLQLWLVPRTKTWPTVWRWSSPTWCPSPSAVPAPYRASRLPPLTITPAHPRPWPSTLYPCCGPSTSPTVNSTAWAATTASSSPMTNSTIQTRKRTDNLPLSVLNYRLIGRMVTMLIRVVPPWPVSPKSQEKAEKQENKSGRRQCSSVSSLQCQRSNTQASLILIILKPNSFRFPSSEEACSHWQLWDCNSQHSCGTGEATDSRNCRNRRN